MTPVQGIVPCNGVSNISSFKLSKEMIRFLQGFRASIYFFPKSVAERQKMLALEQNMVAFGQIIAAPGQ